jgi:cytochrome oxidase Cu insertion factor (SCO1/SenC/PrrC family)
MYFCLSNQIKINMKKLLLCSVLALAGFTVSAQDVGSKCPPTDYNRNIVIHERANAPDFTTTFTDGTSATLYTVLGAGNTVVLDFFYTT